MSARDILRREFDGDDGSFIIIARCNLRWDWSAFRRLTSAMYDVANESRGKPAIETWIANGFWFCDTWIRDWTGHDNFPRPAPQEYRDALELIHDLSYFLFNGESPYLDDTLKFKAKEWVQ